MIQQTQKLITVVIAYKSILLCRYLQDLSQLCQHLIADFTAIARIDISEICHRQANTAEGRKRTGICDLLDLFVTGKTAGKTGDLIRVKDKIHKISRTTQNNCADTAKTQEQDGS